MTKHCQEQTKGMCCSFPCSEKGMSGLDSAGGILVHPEQKIFSWLTIIGPKEEILTYGKYYLFPVSPFPQSNRTLGLF